MTLTLHWWMLPLGLLITGAILLPFTRSSGGWFPTESWHLPVGILLIVAALFISIGGMIS